MEAGEWCSRHSSAASAYCSQRAEAPSTSPGAPFHQAALSAPTFAVPSFELDGLTSEIRSVLGSSDFNDSLDRMRQEVASDSYIHRSVVGSSVAVTTGLSVGYVAWLVRGGVLLSTALSSLPAWQFVDPLPVLAATQTCRKGKNKGQASESDADRIFSSMKNTDRQLKPQV